MPPRSDDELNALLDEILTDETPQAPPENADLSEEELDAILEGVDPIPPWDRREAGLAYLFNSSQPRRTSPTQVAISRALSEAARQRHPSRPIPLRRQKVRLGSTWVMPGNRELGADRRVKVTGSDSDTITVMPVTGTVRGVFRINRFVFLERFQRVDQGTEEFKSGTPAPRVSAWDRILDDDGVEWEDGKS